MVISISHKPSSSTIKDYMDAGKNTYRKKKEFKVVGNDR